MAYILCLLIWIAKILSQTPKWGLKIFLPHIIYMKACCCILVLNFPSFYCKLMFVHIVCKAIHAWNVSNIFYMCVSISDTNRGCNGFSYLIKFMTLHIWWTIYSQYDIAMIFENIRLTIYMIQSPDSIHMTFNGYIYLFVGRY